MSNKISFAGRLAADAEIRNTPNGDPVCSFRVASDVGYGDRKTTNWFQCQVWGKRADALCQHLTKGQQVTVWGTLTLREWNDKDGAKRLSPDVRVDELALQGGKPGGQQRDERPQRASNERQQSDDPFDQDIPFANPYRGKLSYVV